MTLREALHEARHRLAAAAVLICTTVWLCRDPGWDSATATFAALVAWVGTEFSYLQKRVEPSEAGLLHDRALFARYDGILPETALRWEFDNDLFNLHTDTAFTERLEEFAELAARAEGRFLVTEVQSAIEALHASIKTLSVFIWKHFFTNSRNGPAISADRPWRIELYPDLRHEYERGGHVIFKKHAKELPGLVDAVDRSYAVWRAAVKKRLAV